MLDDFVCIICDNEYNNTPYQVKEMLLGYQDEFTYFECSRCGCLQIKSVPYNIDKYYSNNYFDIWELQNISFFKKYVRNIKAKAILQNRSVIGNMLHQLSRKGFGRYEYMIEMLANENIEYEDKILDVGCGKGALLLKLKEIGFNNLMGIDPFAKSVIMNKGLNILKKTIYEINKTKYDLILFNHSFEHILEQLKTLNKVKELLKFDGVCIIRMPIKTNTIWSKYGKYWVQIDAPRHMVIHTLNSFRLLTRKAKLMISKIVFDSTEFQFLASEQYKRGISLRDEKSYMINTKKNLFSKNKIKEMRKLAARMNAIGEGDQATFYIGLA